MPANDGFRPRFGDGLCDVGDPDDDNDTVADGSDNCPVDANTRARRISTGDVAEGDVCDADDDNDGIADGPDLELRFDPDVCLGRRTSDTVRRLRGWGPTTWARLADNDARQRRLRPRFGDGLCDVGRPR